MEDTYLGIINLGDTLRLGLQCRNGSLVATAPDGAPTWSIYGASDTAVLTGTLGAADADSKTGFRTGDAAITAGNGFASGSYYRIRFQYDISAAEHGAIHYFQVA